MTLHRRWCLPIAFSVGFVLISLGFRNGITDHNGNHNNFATTSTTTTTSRSVKRTNNNTTNAATATKVHCHAASSCCARTVPQLQNPYFPYSRDTPTVNDRISPIDMKLIADFHFGSLPQPKQHAKQLLPLSLQNVPCLFDGAVIFVDSINVTDFINHVLPNITTTFVLVSGDSDASMPGQVFLYAHEADRFVTYHRLLHWYAMNCDRNPNPKKFTCLPNGISQWDQKQHQRPMIQSFFQRRRGVGLPQPVPDTTTATTTTSRTRVPASHHHHHHHKQKKDIMLFASFNIHKNPPERQPVWDMACQPDGLLYNQSKCAIGVWVSTCYRYITRSKFVLSPHGLGLDCYRTYEALYLGAFPIVKTSSLDDMFRPLPVLIVQNWTDLAKEGFLERTYQDFMSRLHTFEWERLYKGYWYAKFRSHHPQYRQYYRQKARTSSSLLQFQS